MKKVIERMNSATVEAELAGRKSGASGPSSGKKRWPFGRKASGATSKDLKEAQEGDDDADGMRVDFYLVVFLKFIASIVPTIEVDSTTSM